MNASAAGDLLEAVREFVEREVVPVASELDHADEFPDALVARMAELGLFGMTIPADRGGLGHDLDTYARVQLELGRGWVSLCGVLNPHLLSASLIVSFGTDEQKELLPSMASGVVRSAYAITEPHAGSDVQAISTRADRDDDAYAISGTKAWVANGLRAGLLLLLAKTDVTADPPYRGMTAFLVRKEPGAKELPGLIVSDPTKKLGYRAAETVQLVFDGYRTPASSVLGGEDGVGRGFKQVLSGLETGRIGVAARATGLAQAAFEDAIAYAQHRHAFGGPIAAQQAVQLKLAQMATRIEAARLLTFAAVAKKQSGVRSDLEAGMAKLFATETAVEVALEAMRIHGATGYSQERRLERIYRDAAVLVLGEGSNEIQQIVIARRLLEKHALR